MGYQFGYESKKNLSFIVPNLPTGKWEIMNPPFWISAYCKSGLEDGKNGKKCSGLSFSPLICWKPISRAFFSTSSPFMWNSAIFGSQTEKREDMQGNKSLETQYRIFLAISRPPPASQQTNILLPTGLEFQHLFMFKRVNKRKHAVSRKKVFGNSISKFLTHFHAVTS